MSLPETISLVNTYLAEGMDTQRTALVLGISREDVITQLDKRDNKLYLSTLLKEVGYSNSEKLKSLMDTVVEKKLEECLESDIYSNKDIAELIMLRHKLNEEPKTAAPTNQTNVQINGYNALLEKLMHDPKQT